MTIEGVCSLVISVVSLVISIATYVFTYRFEKNKATVEMYQGIQDKLYIIYSYRNDEIETFVDDRSSDEYKVLSTCLAEIEFFATGIKNGAYSFKIAYQLGHGYLDLTLRKKLDYLLEVKDTADNEKFYKNTRWLLEKMDNHSKKRHRKNGRY